MDFGPAASLSTWHYIKNKITRRVACFGSPHLREVKRQCRLKHSMRLHQRCLYLQVSKT